MIKQVIAFYMLNMSICSFINAIKDTRFPKSVFDFFRLTFLPYILYALIVNPRLLKDDCDCPDDMLCKSTCKEHKECHVKKPLNLLKIKDD